MSDYCFTENWQILSQLKLLLEILDNPNIYKKLLDNTGIQITWDSDLFTAVVTLYSVCLPVCNFLLHSKWCYLFRDIFISDPVGKKKKSKNPFVRMTHKVQKTIHPKAKERRATSLPPAGLQGSTNDQVKYFSRLGTNKPHTANANQI